MLYPYYIYIFIKIYISFSFHIGDVFSVQNVLDGDWLWVVAQKNNKSGVVPKALMEEMVTLVFICLLLKNIFVHVCAALVLLKSGES